MDENSTAALGEAALRIKQSAVLAIVLPDTPGIEVVGSVAMLIAGLRSIKKTVHVFSPPAFPLPILAAPEGRESNPEPAREFIISFDLSRSPIKEVKYERDENRLNIILSPTGVRLRREDVEFRYGPLPYDLVITIGVANPEAAAVSIARIPELLYEKPILNIDANPANTSYGEINLLASRVTVGVAETLPEITHRVLGALSAVPETPEAASALLTALASATENFKIARTSASSFLLAGELVKRGGKIIPLLTLPDTPQRFREEQLAARAVVRSRLDLKSQILWSLITNDDFAKTGGTSALVPRVFAKLTATLPATRRTVLLWEDPIEQGIRAVVSSPQPIDEEKLRARGASLLPTGHIAVHDSFPTFRAAEERIRQLLATLDGVE
ncbi:MAG: hypothetical protein HY473_00225 [Candidatus Sungbacteria bacterium]|uniref:Uncharacterized protein n=1 Tax=Candidatus Sungiibacteriota bacterium TaxID=2750080 RepID=A0A932YW26_9BACT|nr:hypothetical protein [Candidatus Sungbacteria bacterium]